MKLTELRKKRENPYATLQNTDIVVLNSFFFNLYYIDIVKKYFCFKYFKTSNLTSIHNLKFVLVQRNTFYSLRLNATVNQFNFEQL